MTRPDDLDRVLAACDANRDRDLGDLIRLLRQPSISAQNIGVTECAALISDLLRAAGFEPQLFETPRHPMIYAERLNVPGKPTVLIYGHYDVQPPDPLDEWISPPFEPTIRDGRLYARGVGDNKGQHFAQILAIESLLACRGRLPCNVIVLLEGEEEVGSPQMPVFVRAQRDQLAADFVITADGPVH